MILFCHGRSHGRIQFCFRRSAIGSQADLKSMQFMYTTPLAPGGVCVAPTSRRGLHRKDALAQVRGNGAQGGKMPRSSAGRSGGAVRAASREPGLPRWGPVARCQTRGNEEQGGKMPRSSAGRLAASPVVLGRLDERQRCLAILERHRSLAMLERHCCHRDP